MSKLKFVHASDLHLASPFRGVSVESPAIAARLQNATFEAFDSVIKLCIDNAVDFLVVAGDVFDTADRNLRAQLHFHQGLKRLSDLGIASFVAHGNHDPLDGCSSALSWPSNVTIFSAELSSVPFIKNSKHLATVHGISFPSKVEERNLARLFPAHRQANDNAVQIGVLHCNVGSNTGHAAYAPCELADLHQSCLHYWALGHVHQYSVLSENPHVVYPGNTQGRSIRETGPRGCVLVNVSESNAITTAFHTTDSIRWFQANLSIENIDSMNVLGERIEKLVTGFRQQGQGRPVIVRIVLEGRGSLYRELVRDQAIEDCLQHCRDRFAQATPFAWIEQIDVNCLPDIDLSAVALREDLVGSVMRVATRLASSDNDQSAEILRPLLTNSVARTGVVSGPDASQFDELITDAALLCYELLEEP